MERVLVSPETIEVLGRRVKGPADVLWSGLDLERAEPAMQSSLFLAICGKDAPVDIHLRVPWDHPDDKAAGIESGCIYRVRPRMKEGKKWKGRKVARVYGFEDWGGQWWIAFETEPPKRKRAAP